MKNDLSETRPQTNEMRSTIASFVADMQLVESSLDQGLNLKALFLIKIEKHHGMCIL